MGKKSIAVHIAGQRHVVRSDADEDYVLKLARHVNDRIDEVQSQISKPVSAQNLVILAALNIADDLFKEQEQRQSLRRQIREKSRAVLAYLDKEVKSLSAR